MTFRPLHISGHLYFVTGTVIRWLRLFNDIKYTKVILDSMDWHRKYYRMKLFAFVIMPNHLHWISLPLDPCTINDNIRTFASFTAHKILSTAKENNHKDNLTAFAEDAKTGKHNRIWLDFQAKNIKNERFLSQKLEYIHNNPTTKDWFSLESRSGYKYSSACFYDEGKEPIIFIDDLYEYLVNI